MQILLCNDDGVHAHGIRAIYQELKKLGKVVVVAPLEEKSTTGHSLTLHKPLRLIEMGGDFYGVSGSPADCVYMGIRQVLKKQPDFVVSGVNRGANLGQDVYYSGTVSAAREACMLEIPSLAVSLSVNFRNAPPESKIHYSTAARLAVRVIREFEWKKLPTHTLLNLNAPDVPLTKVKGLVWGHQGFRFYSGNIIQRRDHRGKPYYWVGGQYKGFREQEGSDCDWVAQGYASLTPLKLDCTDYATLEAGKRGELFKGKDARRR